eukprot:4829321-Amphidinium_carterae.1
MKHPQGFNPRGFASELEEWSFYLEMAKHSKEVNEDEQSETQLGTKACTPCWIGSYPVQLAQC